MAHKPHRKVKAKVKAKVKPNRKGRNSLIEKGLIVKAEMKKK